jgi:ABC-type nickel/cobalt efflux system permease component RcnA
MRRVVLPLLAAAVLVALGASAALAHPLGNFTINHHAGIRVEPDRVLLDVVIDAAEIPAFQATAELDRDGDGALSPTETAGLPEARCLSIGRGLVLAIDGSPAALRLTAAGVTFPMGSAGLPTMRSACVFEAPLSVAPGGAVAVAFRDEFEPARIGWREITAVGDGMTLEGGGAPTTSASARLTSYPEGPGPAPDERALSLVVRAGGDRLPPFLSPDATPIAPVPVAAIAGASAAPRADGAEAAEAAGDATPSGAEAVPQILGQAPVSPLVAVAALLVAAMLGAGHALTPGHGKTLMAAYLVGTRGTPRHALGLGLAVSISHTAGILGLAIVILAAESTLPVDAVVRGAPIVAAAAVLIIGLWMLATELRRRGVWPGSAARAHPHEHEHEHEHEGEHPHDHGDGHPHEHEGEHPHEHEGEHPDHRHGPIRHSHLPRQGATVTWRGLVLLGLAGGLVPSANALLVLLGTIAAGRPAWGVILVAAFGLGMAAVMAGVGLACVYARGLVVRVPERLPVSMLGRWVPLGAAVVVLGLGIVLTAQAVASARLG